MECFMSREVAWTEPCCRRLIWDFYGRWIVRSTVSTAHRESFLKNQNWFNLPFVVILNWLTVWPNYFLKDGRTLFLMLFFFIKLTNITLRSLISSIILNSVLKGERKKTYLSEQKCLISQEWPSFCINSYLFSAISGRCFWLSSSTENVRILWKMEQLPGAILHCRVIDTPVSPAWLF